MMYSIEGGKYMKIIDYCTDSGKNLIKEYISSLPVAECTYGYGIRHKIIKDGLKAFDGLDTRQLIDKLWEIKFIIIGLCM